MPEIQDSILYLCKNVNLDENYQWTIDFDNKEAQLEYFSSKAVNPHQLFPNEDYSHIKGSDNIKVFANIEDLKDYNYLYYINKEKTYYCFITNKNYVNEDCTDITIKIDVMQTYMFDYELQESFIEKTHKDRFKKSGPVYNPIYYLQEENLNYGDEYYSFEKRIPFQRDIHSAHNTELDIKYYYILRKTKTWEKDRQVDICGLSEGYELLMAFDRSRDNALEWSVANKYTLKNGNLTAGPFPCAWSLFNDTDILSDPETVQVFVSKIPPCKWTVELDENYGATITYDNHNLLITSTTYKDKDVLRIRKLETYGDGLDHIFTVNLDKTYLEYGLGSEYIKNPNEVITYNTDYEPMLKIYPYKYYKIKYGNNDMIIKPQYTIHENRSLGKNSSYITFDAFQSCTNEGTSYIRCTDYPYHQRIDTSSGYNLVVTDTAFSDHMLTKQNPIFANLNTDAWKNYILQNRSSRSAGYANTVLSTGISVASGLLSGQGLGIFAAGASLASGAQKISAMVAKEQDIKNQPTDTRIFNGDSEFEYDISGYNPILCYYEVPNQVRLRLAAYFHHYGYNINKFEIPDIRSRLRFNFIKTTECNIKGNFNRDDINQIKSIYNNGITIWHNRTTTLPNFEPTITYSNEVNNYELNNPEMSFYEEATV